MNEGTELPTNIGKYKILGLLGKGSMGVVYKGFDPEIEREVAIKMLRGVFTHGGDENRLGGLRDEARSAGNLRHPNIITVFEVNVMGASPYIVMDYLHGIALDRLLRRDGALEPQRVVYYLAQAALGLDHAHSKGIVHCDVKPSNLLLEEESETIFILDFGIAKFGTSVDELDGPVVGTPAYMSPEQIMNTEILDGRSDVFSLSIVAFELLTGVRPFPGSDLTTVMSNILQSQPLSLSECAPVYVHCEMFFQRALASKEQRYSSCREMVSALAAVLGFADPFDAASGMPKVVRPQAIDGNFGLKELRVNFNPTDLRTRSGSYSLSTNKIPKVSSKAFIKVFAVIFPLLSALMVSAIFLTLQALVSRIPAEPPKLEISNHYLAAAPDSSREFVRDLKERGAPLLLRMLSNPEIGATQVVYAMRFLRERGVDLVVDAAVPFIRSGARGVRLEALMTVTSFSDKRTTYVLKWGLSDSSPYVRQMVVRELGRGPATRRGRYLGLLPFLALRHYRETSPQVREELASTLHRLKAAIAELKALKKN